jgi:hypothetical protein
MDTILSHDLIMAEPVVKATFVSMPNIRDGVWEYSYSAELHHLLVQRYNGKELRYVEHTHSRESGPDTFMATPRADGGLTVRRVINVRFVPDPSYRIAPKYSPQEIESEPARCCSTAPQADDEADAAYDLDERELGDDAMQLDAVEAEEMISKEVMSAEMQSFTPDELDELEAEQLVFLQRESYISSVKFKEANKLIDVSQEREARMNGAVSEAHARHNADPNMSYKISSL